MQRRLNIKWTSAFVASIMIFAFSAAQAAEKCEKGFVSLFNGKDLTGWKANDGYEVKGGKLITTKEAHSPLFSEKEYSDFILRLEFLNEPAGNNGIGLRATMDGAPGYTGMEIQILDDEHPNYKELKPVQYTGAVYGVSSPKRGHVKPAGEWNKMEITAKGQHIKVKLNGTLITDTDLTNVGPKKIHGHELAGLHRKKGYLAICGHVQYTEFRNIRIKELPTNK
jgi:hypothetical protein